MALGVVFAVRQSRARQPLLPLRLFRSASLSAGTGLVILLMFALFGAMFFMTFYLENVRGLDPGGAGVRLLPMTAMLIVGSPLRAAFVSAQASDAYPEDMKVRAHAQLGDPGSRRRR